MTNPRTIHVRPATPTDLDTLLTYSAVLAQETEGKLLHKETLRAGIQAIMCSPGMGFLLVAEVHDELRFRTVGQLMITYEWSDWRNSVFWWIQSVYVDRPWRRQGIYRAMHTYVLEKARAKGNICGIRLYVEQHNQAAQLAYRHLGLRQAKYILYEEDFSLTQSSSPVESRNPTEVL